MKSDELIGKIAALGGTHRTDILEDNIICFNTRKCCNEAVFANVEALKTALRERKTGIMTTNKSKAALKAASPYSAVLTREQFLFYETRTTAKLHVDGLSDAEVISKIAEENLFQYPTEKSVRRMAQVCLKRLGCLNNESLVTAIAEQPSDAARQVCLYAMMRQYRLVWDFMITVIGEKYRLLDMSYGKKDLNDFFFRLQEQDGWVASWSDNTIVKLKQVFQRILVETGYIENLKSESLNPVLLCRVLEEGIRANGDERALIAFHCFM